MDCLHSIKTVDGDFAVEYEILSPISVDDLKNAERREIALALQDVEGQMEICKKKIEELSVEIDKLTNHADGLDYAVAVISGIITGLIDSFFVGETEIDIKKVEKTRTI